VVRRISLAGRIAVRVGETVSDERDLPGRQPRLAFALLVDERRRPVTREELADNLWPDQRPASWESALRGVVSRVRGFVAASGLGKPELLHADSGTYRLHPLDEVEVDLEFAAALVESAASALAAGNAPTAAERAEQARSVLAQPLLAGIDSTWVSDRRRQLLGSHLQALEVLADARLALGDPSHAATAAEASISLDPFRESAHRTLMRALLATGNGAAGLRAYERCRSLLVEELGVDPSPETQALHLELLRSSPVNVVTPPVASAVAEHSAPRIGSPYLGLRTFDEEDAAWFFGRAPDVSRLLDRMAGSRFLAVLGASGSGKSSLVRAGLVAALRRGALPGSDTWAIRVLRPGAVPTKALVRAVLDLDATLSEGETVARFEGDERALHHLVEAAVGHGRFAPRVLVVIDQFEEVFALCPDVEQRRRFLSLLAAAATAPGGHTMVVVTLRADFFQHLSEHARFADLVSSHQFLVTPMDEVGLAEAIEGPARAAGLTLEPSLVQTIVRDVARRPGALPLLGHALLEVWQHRSGTSLTLEAYRASGGVDGAVAQRAEAVYAGLSDEERRVVRRVLLRLTQPGEGTEATRRRVRFAELSTRFEDDATVGEVVDALTAARLLTVGGPPRGERYVEVSHEALIRGWPRLRAWIAEDLAGLMVHRRLTEAAAEWERLGRDDGALYRGVHLAEVAAWADRDPEAANQLERAYLVASQRSQQVERRRRVRRLQLSATLLGLGLLLTAGLSVFALGQAAQRAQQLRVATARELAAAAVANLDVDPERGVLLALEAVNITRQFDGTVVREAEEALHRAVKTTRVVGSYPHGGLGLAVTSGSTRFATSGNDGTVSVWDLVTGERLRTIDGHDGSVNSLAFSPDDQLLVTTGDDGALGLWDPRSGERHGEPLHGHQGAVLGAAIDPTGRTLATGGADRTVLVWDLASGEPVTRLAGHTDLVNTVAFHPAGGRLLSASSDTTARIWDLATGQLAVELRGHAWQVEQAVFSPDGSRVATGSIDGSAMIWEAETGARLLTLANLSPVTAVGFSPDGTRLAVGGSDGTAHLWEAETGRHVMALAGHTAAVSGVAFSAEGELLLTTSEDGSTRLWDVSVAGGRDWLTAPSASLRYAGVAFSGDGTRFAVPLDGSGASIRDTATGVELRRVTGHDAWLVALTFSPDGRWLAGSAGLGHFTASDSAEASVPVWEVATGRLHVVLVGHTRGVTGVTFSADGRHLVTGSYDGTVREWAADTGRVQRTVDLGEVVLGVATTDTGGWIAVSSTGDGTVGIWDGETLERRHTLRGTARRFPSVAFGPGGRLVTGSEEGTAKVWDGGTGQLLAALPHGSPMGQIAVSPDGNRVTTAGDDGTVRLWDPETGQELLALFGHDRIAFGVAFSPDGRLLASTSPDGTVALHLLPIREFIGLARQRVTRTLTDAECRQYLHTKACPASTGPVGPMPTAPT
jgi:WD40 repeat protein/DNA-binding SARP family transcriptional activator